MDPEDVGASVADRSMAEAPDADSEKDMSPEERMQHRVHAMAEFSDAHARHDHAGMARALEAHDALLDESPAKEGVSDEGAPEEE
jgi:hypothetical protein